ncbi:hypothetical protein I6A60_13875 [Frankia sp. AgB1.9]|uniref:DUF7065 domain-containing protein n=1 Tax=unclassified Frankia TaxID=2632575 RepID=UPI00193216BE|nr:MULTISPECIES: hypothetical protein [unclassified Frankia]MBL7487577.1 hypothetical protein [Frankia sp. AgW1.1]MBL7548959.1 hypothetical protein [Frankia sp. AgB1.9]MBL7620662.1 hypothetical protein [Frankia sp. AgB1.8]
MPDQSTSDRLKRYGKRLTVDDGFHVPTTLDYHWTETNWFALVVPDRKLTIQLYPFFQTNQNVFSAGVYIWDDSGDQWWNCRYAKNFWHLPFPKDPLYDLKLPNGLRYKTIESLQKYEIGFACPDGEAVSLDITWEGVVPANRGSSATHMDQPGRIRGTLVLDGEAIDVNGVGFRDRTWSPRSQFGQGVGPFASMGYTWGTSMTSDDGFFLLSGNLDSDCLDYTLLDGILFRDGEKAKLTQAKRTILRRDPATGCPEAIAIDVTDAEGRTAHISGTTVNRFVVNLYPSLLVWECQTRWTMDGVDLVGEDEDNWGIHDFRRFLRRTSPA